MTAHSDPNVPIETLFEKITDGVDYTELEDAHFTSKQIVDIALLFLEKMGVFNDDLKEWNRKPLLSRDWTTFRVHFEKAHREWKAKFCLTVGQHFPQANAVDTSTATTKSTTNHQTDTVDALTNLATVTAADRATVATLTDKIDQLSSELASSQAKLISSLLDNQRPLKRLLERGESWNTSGGGGRQKDFRGWCCRTMGWYEHPLLPHSRTQVSPPQFQVSWTRNRVHKECNQKGY